MFDFVLTVDVRIKMTRGSEGAVAILNICRIERDRLGWVVYSTTTAVTPSYLFLFLSRKVKALTPMAVPLAVCRVTSIILKCEFANGITPVPGGSDWL